MTSLPNAIKLETKFPQLLIFRDFGNLQLVADDQHTVTPFHIIYPPTKIVKPILFNPLRFGSGNGGLLNMATKELDSLLTPLEAFCCLLAFALGFGSGCMRYLMNPRILSQWKYWSNQITQKALAMYLYETSQAKDITQTVVYCYLQVALLYASSTGNEIKFLTALQLKRYESNMKYFDLRFNYSSAVFAPILICGNRSSFMRQYNPRILIEFEETVELLQPFVKKDNAHFMELKNFLNFLQDIIDYKCGTINPESYLFNFEIIHRITKVWYHVLPSRCNSTALLAGVNHLDRALYGLFIALSKILNHILPSICHMMLHSFDGEMCYWYDEEPLYKVLTQNTEFDDSFYFLETLREINQYSSRICAFFNTRWNMYTYMTLMFRSKNNDVIYPRDTAPNIHEAMITRFRNTIISPINMIHIPALVLAQFFEDSTLNLATISSQIFQSPIPHFKERRGMSADDCFSRSNHEERVSHQILLEYINFLAQRAIGLEKWSYWVKQLYDNYKSVSLQLSSTYDAHPQFELDDLFPRINESTKFNENTCLYEDDFDGLIIYNHCKYIEECELNGSEMLTCLRELIHLRDFYVN